MDIPTKFRERLVKEIRFIVEKINTEADPRTKIYYFSGAYGEMHRLFNLHFDRQLLLAHNVLNHAYQNMKSRADVIVMGRDTLIDFPDGYFEALATYLRQLANNIEKNEDVYPILQDIACLAYIATGNGYYLFQKGLLKF